MTEGLAIPTHVTTAMNVAAGMWSDVAASSEATLIAWAPQMAPYSADELCYAFAELHRTHVHFPAWAEVLEVLSLSRARNQRATQVPRLPEPKASVPPPLNPYREKLRRELRSFHRDRGQIDDETLAAIDARVGEVGEHEQRALAYIEAHPDADWGRVTKEFVDAWIAANLSGRRESTRVQRPVPQPEPEPIPATTLELATTYAERWISADKGEREAMREEAASFTDEMKQAVNAAVKSRREPVG